MATLPPGMFTLLNRGLENQPEMDASMLDPVVEEMRRKKELQERLAQMQGAAGQEPQQAQPQQPQPQQPQRRGGVMGALDQVGRDLFGGDRFADHRQLGALQALLERQQEQQKRQKQERAQLEQWILQRREADQQYAREIAKEDGPQLAREYLTERDQYYRSLLAGIGQPQQPQQPRQAGEPPMIASTGDPAAFTQAQGGGFLDSLAAASEQRRVEQARAQVDAALNEALGVGVPAGTIQQARALRDTDPVQANALLATALAQRKNETRQAEASDKVTADLYRAAQDYDIVADALMGVEEAAANMPAQRPKKTEDWGIGDWEAFALVQNFQQVVAPRARINPETMEIVGPTGTWGQRLEALLAKVVHGEPLRYDDVSQIVDISRRMHDRRRTEYMRTDERARRRAEADRIDPSLLPERRPSPNVRTVNPNELEPVR
jgi:hypothetical protein